MANAKRNNHVPVIKFKSNGRQESSFPEKVIEVFRVLLTAGDQGESAWRKAGPIAADIIRQQANGPIVSGSEGGYDVQPMNGTTTKPRNGDAKKVEADEPFHIVVSRGIARFLEQSELSVPQASEKFGIHYRGLSRLIKEPTPGLVGENFDKVCKAFGITRQALIDLGTPQ